MKFLQNGNFSSIVSFINPLKYKKKIFSIAIAFISTNFCFNASFAQGNPYIREGSIGNPETKSNSCIKFPDPFTFIPLDCWVGEKIIFLPQSKKLREYGYQGWGCNGWFSGNVSYKEAVGKIGTIQRVEKEKYKDQVTVKMDDGRTYCGTVYNGSLSSIGFLRDIENAKKMYTNKILWYSETEIVGYDEQKDNFFSTKVKKYLPVTVIDVVAGWYNSRPVRFIIRNQSGVEGYVDLNMSGTNVSPLLRSLSRFEKEFFEQDPREIFDWPPTVWEAIELEQVFIDMTQKQVTMAWGDPTNINRTMSSGISSEQWVYKNRGYLYFENGILRSIQN